MEQEAEADIDDLEVLPVVRDEREVGDSVEEGSGREVE